MASILLSPSPIRLMHEQVNALYEGTSMYLSFTCYARSSALNRTFFWTAQAMSLKLQSPTANASAWDVRLKKSPDIHARHVRAQTDRKDSYNEAQYTQLERMLPARQDSGLGRSGAGARQVQSAIRDPFWRTLATDYRHRNSPLQPEIKTAGECAEGPPMFELPTLPTGISRADSADSPSRPPHARPNVHACGNVRQCRSARNAGPR